MIHGPYTGVRDARTANPNAAIIRQVSPNKWLVFDYTHDTLFHRSTYGTEFLLKLIQKEPRHTRKPQFYPR